MSQMNHDMTPAMDDTMNHSMHDMDSMTSETDMQNHHEAMIESAE